MNNAVMIDIEALGTEADAAIIAIGAVKFNYVDTYFASAPLGEALYVNVKADGRKIDEKTVRFWLAQSKRAQDALATPEPWPLKTALKALREFVEPKMDVWANGAMFDLGILRHAYGGYPPWNFRQELCMRPVRVIGQRIGMPYEMWMRDLPRHDAALDAERQARYVQAVFSVIGPRP